MIKTYGDRQPGLGTSAIVGALTLAKTGTTARTATFPDAAITVAGSAAALTSGRVPFVTTGGLLTDNAVLLFSGTLLTYGDGTGSPSFVINSAAGNVKNIRLSSAGSRRWEFGGNNVAESGSDAGTPWILAAYNDSGSFIDIPITVLRAAGTAITLARPVTCTGTVTVPNGTAAAPGIRITSEASGWYRASATSMGAAIAGVAAYRMWHDATNGAELQLNQGTNLSAGIYAGAATGFLYFSGSTGTGGGGQLRVYGNTHATKASYVEFTRGTTVSAYFDGSGNLTCNGTVTVPDGTAAAPGIRLTGVVHGLYRIGSTSLGISCAGVAAAQFASAAASYSAAFTLKHTDASLPAWFTHDMANGYIVFGGPAATGLSGGGQVRLYGNTHATKADYVEFTRGATVSAYFDNSGNLTCNGTVTVPNGTAAAPGIRLTSEASGLYRIGSTKVGISVGGVAALGLEKPGTGYGGGFQLLTQADADYTYIYGDRTNAEMRIAPGANSLDGANIRLYGNGHATANQGSLRHSTTDKFTWNATGIGFFGTTPVARPSLAAASGTATRTTFDTATVTLPELAERVKAIIDDWRGYGLGA